MGKTMIVVTVILGMLGIYLALACLYLRHLD